jgi:hypothetical protein
MSWKVLLAPIAGALVSWLASRGFVLTPDQQTAAVAIGATLVTWVGHFWHTRSTATPATPTATPTGKQGGKAIFSMLLALTVVTGIVAACSVLGLASPKSFDEQLASAYGVHTAVANAAATAASTHAITLAEAEQVQNQVISSRALLDAAKSAETAGNASGAASDLALATGALTALQTYLNARLPK